MESKPHVCGPEGGCDMECMESQIPMDTHPHLYAFRAHAIHNIEKWGMQDLETLALAIAEESGEVAQAVLKLRHEGGRLELVEKEAMDLGALCLQLRLAVEAERDNKCHA